MNVKIEGRDDGKEIGLAKPTIKEDGQREEPELHIRDQVRNTPPKAGMLSNPSSLDYAGLGGARLLRIIRNQCQVRICSLAPGATLLVKYRNYSHLSDNGHFYVVANCYNNFIFMVANSCLKSYITVASTKLC